MTIDANRSLELAERFRKAVLNLPFVAERIAAGQQFNAYESASNDEDDDDEDRDYSICIGPISNCRHIVDAEGKSFADLLEGALKLAQHVAFRPPIIQGESVRRPAVAEIRQAFRARANRRTDNGGVYRHELTDADHEQLLEALRSLDGMVVLSGYPSDLYDRALHGWHRIERAALADGALKRTEVLWLNPAARDALPAPSFLEAVA